jgi:hypothetical protein
VRGGRQLTSTVEWYASRPAIVALVPTYPLTMSLSVLPRASSGTPACDFRTGCLTVLTVA